MTVFRLEAERAGAGPHLFPRVFDTIDDACTYAEAVMDRLAGHAAWRVRGFRVVTVDTRRQVTTVAWHDPDDDPDPFAAGVERGSVPPPPGAAPQPPVPARGHAGTEATKNASSLKRVEAEPSPLPGDRLTFQVRPARRPGP